ncbi:MAG: DUF6624 domain-containing protein [Candidatus Berkiella sp.]
MAIKSNKTILGGSKLISVLVKNKYKACIFVVSLVFVQSSIAQSYEVDFIQNEIKAEKTLLQNQNVKDIADVKKIISDMYQTDQKIRNFAIKEKLNSTAMLQIKKMDQFHTDKMKEILLEHKWITISKFGEETANNAWLLIQHADHDPFFQAGCLYVMSNLDAKEYNLKNYAYLYDRVALKFQEIGMKQKFGTQVQLENGEITLLPYEGTINEVEQRRKEVNLESLDEYFLMIKKLYS